MADISTIVDENFDDPYDGGDSTDNDGQNINVPVYQQEEELLSPCAKLEKYALSDNVFNRQMVPSILLEIFRDSSAETLSSDLPTLLEIIAGIANDPETVIRTDLVRRIPHLAAACAEYSYRVPALNNVIVDILLPVIVKYLGDSDSQVRKSTHTTLLTLMEQGLVPQQAIETQVCPKVLDCTYVDVMEYHNVDVALMAKMVPLLGREATEQLFLERFSELCSNQMFYIRKICASSFGEFCSVVGREAYENVLLPCFIELCADEIWGVRKACAEVVMTVSCACSPESRRNALAPAFVRLLQDQSRWVRMSAFQTLGPFISTFADPSIIGLAYNQRGELVLINPAGTEFRINSPAFTDPNLKAAADFKRLYQTQEIVNKSMYENSCNNLENRYNYETDDNNSVMVDDKENINTSRNNLNSTTTVNGDIGNETDSNNSTNNSSNSNNNNNSSSSDTVVNNCDYIQIIFGEGDTGATTTPSPPSSSSITSATATIDTGITAESETKGSEGDSTKDVDVNNVNDLSKNIKNLTLNHNDNNNENNVNVDAVDAIDGDDNDNKENQQVNNCTKDSKDTDDELNKYNFYQYWHLCPDLPLDPEIVNSCGSPKKNATGANGPNKINNTLTMDNATSNNKSNKGTDFFESLDRILDNTFKDLDLFCPPAMENNKQFNDIFSTTALNTTITVTDEKESWLSSVVVESEPKQDIVPQMLIDHFVSMTDPNLASNTDSDMAYHCAFSLPAVALTLGRNNWYLLKQTCHLLASDMQYKIRRTIASSLHELALILGQEMAAEYLLPIFDEFIKDLDEVRIGVLKHLAHFLKLIGPEQRNQYLPRLEMFLKTDNQWNWRFREEVANQLLLAVPLFTPADASKFIATYAQELLCDKVYAVRQVALALVTELVRHLAGEQMLLSCFLLKLAEEFAHSKRWVRRQVFVLLCSRLVSSNALPTEHFATIMPHLLDLSWDPVPNVRLAVSRTLTRDFIIHEYFSDVNSEQYEPVNMVLKRLQSDKDRDVRQYAVPLVH